MRIEEQEVFVSDDGQRFLDRGEAEAHERKLKVGAVVANFFHYDMGEDQLVEAILENSDAIMNALI